MSLSDEIEWRPSPNYNVRLLPIRFLIIHYTGMEDGDLAVQQGQHRVLRPQQAAQQGDDVVDLGRAGVPRGGG